MLLSVMLDRQFCKSYNKYSRIMIIVFLTANPFVGFISGYNNAAFSDASKGMCNLENLTQKYSRIMIKDFLHPSLNSALELYLNFIVRPFLALYLQKKRDSGDLGGRRHILIAKCFGECGVYPFQRHRKEIAAQIFSFTIFCIITRGNHIKEEF